MLLGALGVLALMGAASAQTKVPANYPADYAKIADAAQSEKGLLIYGNLPEDVWAPAIAGFKTKYPAIKVETLDMGGELWERYYAEKAAGTRTADIILTGTIDRWLEFVDRGEVADYKSPESAALPDWSKPFPGLYTVSTDPLILVYNKHAVPGGKPPASLADVVALTEKNAAQMKGKVTTYDAAANPFGLAIYWTWVRDTAAKWAPLDKIGTFTRPERSAGTMQEKLQTGEYNVGVFFSGASIPRLKRPGTVELLDYTFAKDGTPMMMRGVAITKGAGSPNAAKLFLDYMLSREGQIAFAKGGLTPYRDDIARSDVPFQTLGSIGAEIGKENVLIINYDKNLVSQRDAFIARWKQAFRAAP
jgi:iron(III) transport system substrate-binding protein